MIQPLRILAGGIMHETNSFSPILTSYQDFLLNRERARYADEAGTLAPFDGAHGIELVPAFVASAQPGGLVRRETYEQLKSELLAEFAAGLPADGLLLDLHGAMEVEEIGDGESDLLRAVRELVGEAMPIAVSLDLHGNISPVLIEGAQILTAYRTAPHRDAPATRRRALGLLVQAIRGGTWPTAAMVKLPLVLAGEAAVTDVEPARSLYAQLATITDTPGVLDASLMIGCAWTDSPFARVSIIVVAEHDHALAERTAATFAGQVWQLRGQFGYAVEALGADAAIQQAIHSTVRPVYLSDSGDNVTAGAPGDSAHMLARLVAAQATDTLVAGLVDAPAVVACCSAGVGATISLELGASLDPSSGPPQAFEAVVEHVEAGETQGKGATALVRIEGIRVILTAERQAFTERAGIVAHGVDPQAQQIVVVKLGYLFPDLAAHAPRAIMVMTPGATSLRLETLPYQRIGYPVFPLSSQAIWPVP
jgi:microcystin degradation protein MlrC